jgi:hypothetical protein
MINPAPISSTALNVSSNIKISAKNDQTTYKYPNIEIKPNSHDYYAITIEIKQTKSMHEIAAIR